jgi:hypothetical protein
MAASTSRRCCGNSNQPAREVIELERVRVIDRAAEQHYVAIRRISVDPPVVLPVGKCLAGDRAALPPGLSRHPPPRSRIPPVPVHRAVPIG